MSAKPWNTWSQSSFFTETWWDLGRTGRDQGLRGWEVAEAAMSHRVSRAAGAIISILPKKPEKLSEPLPKRSASECSLASMP